MNTHQEQDNNKKIRAFIAISFPKKVIIHLKDIQTHLQTYKFKASWVKPSNIHLTMKFLGDIPVKTIHNINQSIHNAVLEFKKENKGLSLSVKGIGVFPSVEKPKIIWAGIQPDIQLDTNPDIKGQTSSLENMHSLLNRHLGKTGFKKDKKQFSPHVTLCRLKQSESEKRIAQIIKNHEDFTSDYFNVNSIILFKSQLTPSGAIHTQLFSEGI